VAVLQHVIKGPRGLAVLRLSGDAGASFGKRKVISDDFRDVGETALALGQGKRVYAAFVHLRGDLPNKPDRVVVWSGRNLKGAARIIGNGHEPALAVGVTGDVWLAWRNDGEIFLARSTDRGKSFSTPENISDTPGGLVPHAPGYSSHPSVDVDVNGRVYVAWQEAITDTDDEVAAFTLP
jgi:hypothetical protein